MVAMVCYNLLVMLLSSSDMSLQNLPQNIISMHVSFISKLSPTGGGLLSHFASGFEANDEFMVSDITKRVQLLVLLIYITLATHFFIRNQFISNLDN